MDPINVNTVAHALVFSDKDSGSLYRDTSLGVNLKREVTIRHAAYVDSKTKRPGRRSVCRYDRYVEMSDGTIAPVSCMVILMVPEDANVTTAIVEDVHLITANFHGAHEGYTNIGATFIAGGQ